MAPRKADKGRPEAHRQPGATVWHGRPPRIPRHELRRQGPRGSPPASISQISAFRATHQLPCLSYQAPQTARCTAIHSHSQPCAHAIAGRTLHAGTGGSRQAHDTARPRTRPESKKDGIEIKLLLNYHFLAKIFYDIVVNLQRKLINITT